MSCEPPRCASCGELIGVYEPIVVVKPDGALRETSIAADPQLETGGASLYHRGCMPRIRG